MPKELEARIRRIASKKSSKKKKNTVKRISRVSY